MEPPEKPGRFIDNFTGYVGGLESPLFGQPTAAFEKRRQQIGVRIDF